MSMFEDVLGFENKVIKEVNRITDMQIAYLLSHKIIDSGITATIIYEEPNIVSEMSEDGIHMRYTANTRVKDLTLDFSEHDKRVIEKHEKSLENQKHGKWVSSEIPCEKYVCSECGGACWYYDVNKTVSKSSYCPNCGAKMDTTTED